MYLKPLQAVLSDDCSCEEGVIISHRRCESNKERSSKKFWNKNRGGLIMGPEEFFGAGARKTANQWPDLPPRDLAIRLADALQYESCHPQDLWDEISEWLTLNNVIPPVIRKLQLVSQEHCAAESPKFPSLTQQGSTMQLTRLIYTSKHQGLNTHQVDQILQKSRANNVRDLITGALIVGESDFMQLLEGSRENVGKSFMRIMQDKRHYNVQITTCGDVAQRLFQEWSMHLIKASQIKESIISNYKIGGNFDPSKMSEFAVEDLCRTLSGGKWDVEAA